MPHFKQSELDMKCHTFIDTLHRDQMPKMKTSDLSCSQFTCLKAQMRKSNEFQCFWLNVFGKIKLKILIHRQQLKIKGWLSVTAMASPFVTSTFTSK